MFACGILNDSKTGAAMDEINSIAEMVHNIFTNSECMMNIEGTGWDIKIGAFRNTLAF